MSMFEYSEHDIIEGSLMIVRSINHEVDGASKYT